jgi:predicted secreted protein
VVVEVGSEWVGGLLSPMRCFHIASWMVAHLPVASRAALEINERRTGLVACHEIRPHSTISYAVAALLFAQIVAFFKIGQIRKFNLNDCRVVKHKLV